MKKIIKSIIFWNPIILILLFIGVAIFFKYNLGVEGLLDTSILTKLFGLGAFLVSLYLFSCFTVFLNCIVLLRALLKKYFTGRNLIFSLNTLGLGLILYFGKGHFFDFYKGYFLDTVSNSAKFTYTFTTSQVNLGNNNESLLNNSKLKLRECLKNYQYEIKLEVKLSSTGELETFQIVNQGDNLPSQEAFSCLESELSQIPFQSGTQLTLSTTL